MRIKNLSAETLAVVIKGSLVDPSHSGRRVFVEPGIERHASGPHYDDAGRTCKVDLSENETAGKIFTADTYWVKRGSPLRIWNTNNTWFAEVCPLSSLE